MTIDDVQKHIARIRELAQYDDAAAHAQADGLYYNVLRAIANLETRDPIPLAAAAIQVENIKFSRCYE